MPCYGYQSAVPGKTGKKTTTVSYNGITQTEEQEHVKAEQDPFRQTHLGDHRIADHGAAVVAAGNRCRWYRLRSECGRDCQSL